MKKQLIVALVVCASLATFYFVTREKQVRVGMRELTLPQFSQQNVTKIDYSGKEKFALKKSSDGFVLELNDNGKTREVPAGKQVVKDLFEAVLAVRSGAYVTEQVEKHDQFMVTEEKGQKVTLYSNDKPVWSLIIGDYADEGGRYVRVPSQNAVFLAKARFWDITRSSKNDFRERQIIGLDLDSISSVRLEKGTEVVFGFVRDDKNNWGFDAKTASAMQGVQVSSARAADFVKTVTGLRAASFVESPDAMQKAQALLGASTERVIVTPKNKGSDLIVVVASDAKEKKAYAQIQGTNAVFEISDYIYGRLHPKADDFRQAEAGDEKGKANVPAGAPTPTNINSLPPELQKQIQEAIRKQQQQQGKS